MVVADLSEQSLRQVISEEMDRSGLAARVRQLQGGAPLVTALPSGPVDGQEVAFLADATKGVVWPLRYRAASASIYKWEVVGSAVPLQAEVTTSEARANTVYGDLTTVGPSLVAPLAGDWDIATRVLVGLPAVAAAMFGNVAPKIGAATAVDSDGVLLQGQGTASSQTVASLEHEVTRTIVAAATTVKQQYRTGDAVNSVTFQRRRITLAPRRVG